MREKIVYGVIIFFILVLSGFIFVFYMRNNEFRDLEPKAVYNGYRIYDLVEQKKLACAEAIDVLAKDDKYVYYFNCLKSDKIYLVNNVKIIKVKDAYKDGLITKEKLFELGIVDRMVKIDDEE